MTQIITNNNGGGGGNGEKYIAGQDIAISGGLQTDTGSGSISVSGAISLDGVIAYGGVVQNGTPTPNNPVDIECNNGVLKVNNGVVYADGTQETISDGTNTANAEMLLAISSDRDEQNLINGKITRKIKALVLDGTEGWTLTSSPLGNIFKADILDDNMFSWLICTHFKNGSPLEDNTVYKSAGLPTLQIRYDTATSVEEFIQFLENQNTNGTPVIVLYSLNTPTKESVAGQTLALTDGDGTFTITDAQITPLNIGVSYRIPGNIIDFTNETGYITEEDLPDFDKFQLKSNMVDNLDDADDTHYPTAKAVKEAISASGGGDVTGPASSTDGDIVLFDGVSGKIIKDSGALLSSKLDASAMSNNNYGGAWSGDSTHTPTKGVLYDKIHTMDVEIGNKAADTSVVKLTGNQTINGEKTFGTSPIVPSKTTDATNTGTAIATEAQVYNVQQDVDAIDDLIPNAATSSNQLADKDYVNDSINSVTAYYITKNAQGDQWSTYAELAAATTFYSGGVVRVPTRNDYTIVLADENHDNATTRYSYQGSGWEYQYTVNETALTQAQLDALNSGITSAKVSDYDGYASQISGKQNQLVSGTNIKTINNQDVLGNGDLVINEVPSGGTEGQVLTKTDDGIDWEDAPATGVISSNHTYEDMIHLSQAEYDALVSPDPDTFYSTPDDESGAFEPENEGTEGQVLTKTNTGYAFSDNNYMNITAAKKTSLENLIKNTPVYTSVNITPSSSYGGQNPKTFNLFNTSEQSIFDITLDDSYDGKLMKIHFGLPCNTLVNGSTYFNAVGGTENDIYYILGSGTTYYDFRVSYISGNAIGSSSLNTSIVSVVKYQIQLYKYQGHNHFQVYVRGGYVSGKSSISVTTYNGYNNPTIYKIY